jgi:hypothetical protein
MASPCGPAASVEAEDVPCLDYQRRCVATGAEEVRKAGQSHLFHQAKSKVLVQPKNQRYNKNSIN